MAQESGNPTSLYSSVNGASKSQGELPQINGQANDELHKMHRGRLTKVSEGSGSEGSAQKEDAVHAPTDSLSVPTSPHPASRARYGSEMTRFTHARAATDKPQQDKKSRASFHPHDIYHGNDHDNNNSNLLTQSLNLPLTSHGSDGAVSPRTRPPPSPRSSGSNSTGPISPKGTKPTKSSTNTPSSKRKSQTGRSMTIGVSSDLMTQATNQVAHHSTTSEVKLIPQSIQSKPLMRRNFRCRLQYVRASSLKLLTQYRKNQIPTCFFRFYFVSSHNVLNNTNNNILNNQIFTTEVIKNSTNPVFTKFECDFLSSWFDEESNLASKRLVVEYHVVRPGLRKKLIKMGESSVDLLTIVTGPTSYELEIFSCDNAPVSTNARHTIDFTDEARNNYNNNDNNSGSSTTRSSVDSAGVGSGGGEFLGWVKFNFFMEEYTTTSLHLTLEVIPTIDKTLCHQVYAKVYIVPEGKRKLKGYLNVKTKTLKQENSDILYVPPLDFEASLKGLKKVELVVLIKPKRKKYEKFYISNSCCIVNLSKIVGNRVGNTDSSEIITLDQLELKKQNQVVGKLKGLARWEYLPKYIQSTDQIYNSKSGKTVKTQESSNSSEKEKDSQTNANDEDNEKATEKENPGEEDILSDDEHLMGINNNSTPENALTADRSKSFYFDFVPEDIVPSSQPQEPEESDDNNNNDEDSTSSSESSKDSRHGSIRANAAHNVNHDAHTGSQRTKQSEEHSRQSHARPKLPIQLATNATSPTTSPTQSPRSNPQPKSSREQPRALKTEERVAPDGTAYELVERIIGKRTRGNEKQYKIVWVGLPKSTATWVWGHNLLHCEDMLRNLESESTEDAKTKREPTIKLTERKEEDKDEEKDDTKDRKKPLRGSLNSKPSPITPTPTTTETSETQSPIKRSKTQGNQSTRKKNLRATKSSNKETKNNDSDSEESISVLKSLGASIDLNKLKLQDDQDHDADERQEDDTTITESATEMSGVEGGGTIGRDQVGRKKSKKSTVKKMPTSARGSPGSARKSPGSARNTVKGSGRISFDIGSELPVTKRKTERSTDKTAEKTAESDSEKDEFTETLTASKSELGLARPEKEQWNSKSAGNSRSGSPTKTRNVPKSKVAVTRVPGISTLKSLAADITLEDGQFEEQEAQQEKGDQVPLSPTTSLFHLKNLVAHISFPSSAASNNTPPSSSRRDSSSTSSEEDVLLPPLSPSAPSSMQISASELSPPNTPKETTETTDTTTTAVSQVKGDHKGKTNFRRAVSEKEAPSKIKHTKEKKKKEKIKISGKGKPDDGSENSNDSLSKKGGKGRKHISFRTKTALVNSEKDSENSLVDSHKTASLNSSHSKNSARDFEDDSESLLDDEFLKMIGHTDLSKVANYIETLKEMGEEEEYEEQQEQQRQQDKQKEKPQKQQKQERPSEDGSEGSEQTVGIRLSSNSNSAKVRASKNRAKVDRVKSSSREPTQRESEEDDLEPKRRMKKKSKSVNAHKRRQSETAPQRVQMPATQTPTAQQSQQQEEQEQQQTSPKGSLRGKKTKRETSGGGGVKHRTKFFTSSTTNASINTNADSNQTN